MEILVELLGVSVSLGCAVLVYGRFVPGRFVPGSFVPGYSFLVFSLLGISCS
jgi:hypothetical protein